MAAAQCKRGSSDPYPGFANTLSVFASPRFGRRFIPRGLFPRRTQSDFDDVELVGEDHFTVEDAPHVGECLRFGFGAFE